MQPQHIQSGSMDTNSLNFKSIVRTLQVVIKHQENQQKKNNCANILQRFIESKNSSLLKQLDKENQLRLVEIRTMLKLYRNAFQKITQKQQYKQFKIPEGRIAEHLLNMQQQINPKDYKTSYTRAITLKKKQFKWSKELIQDWMKAFDQERIIEEEKTKQKQLERNQSIKSQPLPQSLPNSSIQNPQTTQQNQNSQAENTALKLEDKKPPQKPLQKSSQKIPGQKPEKKVKKDEAIDKGQKQKKAVKQKKQHDDSQSSENDGGKQLQAQKAQKQARSKIARYQKPKQPKNRVKALMQYLSSRKDLGSLSSNPTKVKQIAEFLNQNLQKFMKHHLSNLIEIAKLRNKKHFTMASSGNEFTYFSREGYTPVKTISHLQVSQQPARMLKLNYRSKFEMYSMLRTREQILEDALLREYASKRDSQNNKTSDKRLWEYLLRPSNVIERAEQYVEMEESKTDRLSIEIAHIRYLFQAHKYIRNSWLMINCYNS